MIRRRRPPSVWEIQFEELVDEELYEIIYGIKIDKKRKKE
tara:strand:- start:2436 stop:2555 length:120 start_codon:yes stop_codon:yes gene_type:complete